MPLYNQYIEKVSQDIPAMNVNGYMDMNGKWHNYGDSESKTVSSLLHNYEILQYGYYSDSDKTTMKKIIPMEVNMLELKKSLSERQMFNYEVF